MSARELQGKELQGKELRRRNLFLKMHCLFDQFLRVSTKAEKLELLEMVMSTLMTRDGRDMLMSNGPFFDVIHNKCAEFVTDPLAFKHISPVIHRYFFADVELMKQLRKVRNAKKRRVKQHTCPCHCAVSAPESIPLLKGFHRFNVFN